MIRRINKLIDVKFIFPERRSNNKWQRDAQEKDRLFVNLLVDFRTDGEIKMESNRRFD